MDKKTTPNPAATRKIKVTVPEDVADFYDRQGQRVGGSLSGAASPVLCAYARGEIRQDFTQQPGTDLRAAGRSFGE